MPVSSLSERACPNCGGDIRPLADGRQEPASFEPEVRKRKKVCADGRILRMSRLFLTFFCRSRGG